MARSAFWIGLLLMTAGLWAIAPEFSAVGNGGTRQATVPGPALAGWTLLVIGALFVVWSQIVRLRDRRRQQRPRAVEKEGS